MYLENRLKLFAKPAVWEHLDFGTTPISVFFFVFFVTFKPRVEWYTKSMSLKYDFGIPWGVTICTNLMSKPGPGIPWDVTIFKKIVEIECNVRTTGSSSLLYYSQA